MKRLAIISSYDENCGNASYTHVLMREFSKHVQVDILPLDLFVLQKPGKAFRQHGDDHIRELAKRLKAYDYVNIQFEAGLYGTHPGDILRRVSWLIDAAPNVVVTMHRVDPLTDSAFGVFKANLFQRDRTEYRRRWHDYAYSALYRKLVAHCDKASKSKNAWVCVHTKRERRLVQDIYKVANVFDYPLTFLNPQERADVRAYDGRDEFLAQHGFPADAKVIGVFGFISEYKSFETAISSLGFLPKEYHVGIFGSQHPQSVRAFKKIDTYLQRLMTMSIAEGAKGKGKKIEIDRAPERPSAPTVKKSERELIESSELEVLSRVNVDPTTFQDRVHFVGNLPDPDFIGALRYCDAVVLPYLEVGQSMSGVVALAVEADAKMFCANNLSFFENQRYYGEVFEGFDIGNYLQLSQKIKNGARDFSAKRDEAYGNFNIIQNIETHLKHFGHR